MEEDWRIVNQYKYLHGRTLRKTTFIPTKNCDHVHCSFCWDKFGLENNMLHFGYLTTGGNWWICEQCFFDFKVEFEWRLEESDNN